MDRSLDRPLLSGGLARPLLSGGLALLLGGCSGTPFGDRLAGSFSSPPSTSPSTAPTGAPTAAPTGAPAGNPTADPTAPGAAPGAPPAVQSGAGPGANGAAKPDANPAAKTAAGPAAPPPPSGSPAQVPGAKQTPAAATNLQPAPYRITLKLPQADPAAPAESVTQALRAAGLRFEVEMIERVQPTSSAPGAAPAPR
jgi:hypothetical protein